MIKTILFDVDGTIIDTEYVMTHSLQKTLREELEKELPIQELHYILGIPGREAIKKFVNTEEEEDILLSKWGKKFSLISRECPSFSTCSRNITEVAHKRDSTRNCYI